MKGKLQFSDDPTACAICSTEVLRADQDLLLGDQVFNHTFHATYLFILFETQQFGIEPVLEAVLRCIPDQNGFQSALG